MKKSRLSSQDIYKRLRQMIMDFSLLPGARVTETELAELFDVSRTPIREALHKLEVEGFLKIRPKQGCFIREVDIAEISDYYDVRVALEGMAVELACERIPNEVLVELSAVWDPATRPQKLASLEKIKDIEEDFHVTLAEHSGNPVLAHYLREVNDHIRVIRRLAFIDEQTMADTYDDHHAICQLLLKRDAAAAREAMIHHIRKSQLTARNVTLTQIQQHSRSKLKARPPLRRKVRI